MTKTVIDQLVVKLGLDSSDYQKGKAAADAVQRSLKQTALADAQATETAGKKTGKTVSTLAKERKRLATDEQKRNRQADKDRLRSTELEKKSTEGTLSRLKNLGLALGAAVLGFKTLEGAIAAYAATSGNLANLGRLAPTVGTSPAGVNVLGNALKQVGGTQSDANADLMKIGQSQFSYQIHNPDQFAAMARNLGVGLFDSKGKARDKIAILTDIGSRLRAMTPDVQAQAMYARQMGLSEASIQLFVVDQAKVRRQILQDAIKTNAVTAQGTQNAIAASTVWAQMKNRVQAVKDKFVSGEDASLATGGKLMLDPNVPTSNKVAAAIIGFFGGFGQRDLDALNSTSAGSPKPYEAAFSAAEKKYGLRSGTLEAIAWQESRFNPNAVNKKSGARGLMQLNPKYFKNAGASATADINTAAAELARLLKVYHGDYAAAFAAYNDGEGNYDKYRAGTKALPRETANYVPSVLGKMQGAAGAAATVTRMGSPASAPPASAATTSGVPTVNNNVSIDNIIVNTQAKDANSIAAALPDALRRKGIIASANTGLV